MVGVYLRLPYACHASSNTQYLDLYCLNHKLNAQTQTPQETVRSSLEPNPNPFTIAAPVRCTSAEGGKEDGGQERDEAGAAHNIELGLEHRISPLPAGLLRVDGGRMQSDSWHFSHYASIACCRSIGRGRRERTTSLASRQEVKCRLPGGGLSPFLVCSSQ